MGVAVMPVLPSLVGSRGTRGSASRSSTSESIVGWLLQDKVSTAAAASSSIASAPSTVEWVLLLGGSIDIVGRLLADGHAKLVEICQLALDRCQAGGLALHCLLGGSVRGAEVGNGLAIRCNCCIVVHRRHAVVVLDGWRGHLVDEGDRLGPVVLERFDRLGDRRRFVLPRNSALVLLGVHAAAFDDMQADINDIALLHRIAGCAFIRRANEEVRREQLKAIRGMPVGGHPLSVLFVVLGHCLPILSNKPVEHVEEDSVWLFHADGFVGLANLFGELGEEDVRERCIHCDDVSTHFVC
jgi:hypothetical protein